MTGKKKVDFGSLNRVMNFKPVINEKKLVCITDKKKVLRITREEAENYFFTKRFGLPGTLRKKQKEGFMVDMKNKVWYKPTFKWFYTTKQVYKQYKASLVPNSKIPDPKFHLITYDKDMKKVKQSINIFTH